MKEIEKLARELCREFWDARYPNNKTIAKKEFEYRRKEWMALADHVTNSKIEVRLDELKEATKFIPTSETYERVAELERQLKEGRG